LEVTCAGSRFFIKAGGASDNHIGREIHAHRRWLGPWTSTGRAPVLVHADEGAPLLVTSSLPGQLVLRSGHDNEPDTYLQAGELLARFHAQTAVLDQDYEERGNDKALAWLGGPHRIAAPVVAELRAQIASWPTPPATLSPTHGDWQPRNWLIHDGIVSVIDFGRADMRPALTDFARLAAQDFRRNPALEQAFLDGYGSDPRERGAWYRTRRPGSDRHRRLGPGRRRRLSPPGNSRSRAGPTRANHPVTYGFQMNTRIHPESGWP
jgi:hypothetical protein